VLTMMADEFGGEIPVGPFALIGDDSIGRGIVDDPAGSRSPAVLMQNHGPFTIGPDARAAVKAAVMLEDVARTVHITRQLGDPSRWPRATSTAVRALPERLRTASPTRRTAMTKPYGPAQIWFLTGSQDLYGDETLAQVAEQSGDHRRTSSTRRRSSRRRVVWKPVLKEADAIRRHALEANADDACIGVIAWMHTFSPAKMWIAGPGGPAHVPLLHLHTQANATCRGPPSTWTS
jgi:hypothetical protein